MKKLSHIIKSEQAFYFPFVLMIAMIVLSAVATTTIIYRNEVVMTQQIIHQIEAETMIQMSKKQFVDSVMYNELEEGEIIYELPNGTSILKHEQIAPNHYVCHLKITTNEQFTLETILHLVIESD